MSPDRLLTLLALVLTFARAFPVHAQHVEVEELHLDNGMKFLLVPRDEEPHTISAAWVAKVGSVNERPGITGMTHLFEHMMFKGTRTIGTTDPERDAEFTARQKEIRDRMNLLIWTGQYEGYRRGEIDDPWDPANDTDEIRGLRAELRELMEAHRAVIEENEFSRIYTNAGATGMNAFTSNDMTFFFINVPANKFELWAWMESDRLSDSVFREFEAERSAVHNERRQQLESNPTGELTEQFDAMFWQSSPYSWSVIGWPSDLESYSRESFDDYFNVYYRPNNLVGVVVGDFDPREIKPVIERYFGRLKRGDREPPPVVTLEVAQIAEKRMLGSCDCQPQVRIQYHTVPFAHRDGFALDVLGAILNGRTGRLYKSMIEGREIASSAAAGHEGMKYAGLFAFVAEVKSGATPEDLEQAWYAEVERLHTEPVDPLELQKVKNQIAADSYRRLRANDALLFQLGMYEALGGWEYLNEAPARLAAVTAEDIQRVARTYLTPENRNVALYTRRAGSFDDEALLASLDPQVRAQVEMMLGQILTHDSASDLEGLLAQMETQAAAVPEPFRPAMQYVYRKIRERIRALRAEGKE